MKIQPKGRLGRLGRYWCWLVLALYALVLPSIEAQVAAPPGAAPASVAPAHIQALLPQARLAGQGRYTWFGLSIYDAQLWLGPQAFNNDDSARFVLDLRYARNLVGKKIARASFDEMQKLGRGSAAQREAWLQKMEAIFPDVQEGNHISGAFLPNEGAQFFLDGKPLAKVADIEFAKAFFAIWLDPNSSAAPLRKALLRDAAAR